MLNGWEEEEEDIINCQLLYQLKEKKRYCNLTEEALVRSLWRTGFGRDYGPAAGLIVQ
jgi:hypothetical protein